jgi:predicted GH43/DUF377 family glycosyl hydrolase
VVNEVVLLTGIVEKNDELYLYYGAADKYVCLAKVKIDDILKVI